MFLVALLLMTQPMMTAFAAGEENNAPALKLEAAYDEATKQVTATVKIAECDDLWSILLNLKYNNKVLAYNSCETLGVAKNTQAYNVPLMSHINLLFEENDLVKGATCAEEQVILKVVFDVVGSGDSGLRLSKTEIIIGNVDFKNAGEGSVLSAALKLPGKETTGPSQPTTPTEPTSPANPSQPTTPSQGVKPEPTNPDKPPLPTTPSQGVKPEPTNPDKPPLPTTPSQGGPVTPVEPEPSQPTTPSQPDTPEPGEPETFKITGRVSSYNHNNETVIKLYKAGHAGEESALVKDAKIAIDTDASAKAGDSVEQVFVINGVANGEYDLVISKTAHLSYTVKGIKVANNDVDLTAHANAAIQTITLPAGNVTSSGSEGEALINSDDLNFIWKPQNYLKKASDADVEAIADINGDGEINSDDLNIIWKPANYLKKLSDCIAQY